MKYDAKSLIEAAREVIEGMKDGLRSSTMYDDADTQRGIEQMDIRMERIEKWIPTQDIAALNAEIEKKNLKRVVRSWFMNLRQTGDPRI